MKKENKGLTSHILAPGFQPLINISENGHPSMALSMAMKFNFYFVRKIFV